MVKEEKHYNPKELEKVIQTIPELLKYKRELRQIASSYWEILNAIADAIYTNIKSEVGVVEECEINYWGVPIKIDISNAEVRFYLRNRFKLYERYNYSVEDLVTKLIKYAPKICKKLERDIEHNKNMAEKKRKEYEAILDILAPLLVEVKLTQR